MSLLQVPNRDLVPMQPPYAILIAVPLTRDIPMLKQQEQRKCIGCLIGSLPIRVSKAVIDCKDG